MTLRRKLLIAGSLLVVIPLAFVGGFAYWQGSTQTINSTEDHTQRLSLGLANLVDAVMGGQLEIIQEVSVGNTTIRVAGAVARDGLEASGEQIPGLDRKLTSFMKKLGENYDSVFVLDPKGRVISDGVGGRLKGKTMADQAWFKTAIAGGNAVGEIKVDEKTGQPLAMIAVPVQAEGRIVGVTAAALKLLFWGERVAGLRIGKTGYALLLGPDTVILAHPSPDMVLKVKARELPGLAEIGKRIMAGETGVEEYRFQGADKVAGYAPVPTAGWSVVFTQDKSEFMRPVMTVRNGIIAMGLILLVIQAVAGMLFSGRLSKAILQVTGMAETVAKGDLNVRLDLARSDEIGRMAQALDAMVEALSAKARLAVAVARGDLTRTVEISSDQDMLGRALDEMTGQLTVALRAVRDASNEIAEGSGGISASSEALSQGATQQAASLEQLTSTMTEIGSQTRENAENARQANLAAKEAASCTDEGNQRMERLVAAMNGVSGSSREIAKIIKAIDDIAFQTNLLALNAAVEAARAGKHGKGFAVVAQEVRNLAGRSAKAAGEVADLIDGAVKSAGEGSKALDETSAAFNGIMTANRKVVTLIGEIAAATNEQAEGVAQINEGLSQIEKVTQQNTANAEETASAAAQLSSQADRLRRLLTRFQLDGGQAAPAPSTPSLPPPVEPRRSLNPRALIPLEERAEARG